MRIAVAGFQHETNTFASSKADFMDFVISKDWPGLCTGPEMFEKVAGFHLPITGAIERLEKEDGIEIVPLSWAFAMPSGFVTNAAFEKISSMIVTGLHRAGPVDGIYLDLHGAMVTEDVEDAEGELLDRIRKAVGPDLPIVSSLDYHANITPKMVALTDCLEVYRTYPHVDMALTGQRAIDVLLHIIKTGVRLRKEIRKSNYLIPLNLGCTTIEPCKTLMGPMINKYRDQLEGDGRISFAAGFALSDIEYAGPTILVYGNKEIDIKTIADDFGADLDNAEPLFGSFGVAVDEAVSTAIEKSKNSAKPIILADTQDNPGAGGTGDTTGLLSALLEANANRALCGIISDPAAAKLAHEAGIGESIDAGLAGKLFEGDSPVYRRYRVLALGDGEVLGTGPMWKGARMQLGLCALLSHNGVKIAVASRTIQAGDRSLFHHLDVDPEQEAIIALKSSVHFRADFEPIAEEVIVVIAPGPVIADPRELTYRNLRTGVRIGPMLDDARADMAE